MAAYIFQKPWLWSDLALSYNIGKFAVHNAFIPRKKIDLQQLIAPSLLAFSNFFLARNISVLSQNDVAEKCLRYALIATMGLNVVISQIHAGKSTNPGPKDKPISYTIWDYTPKTLAIVNAVLIILGTKEKPVITIAYTVTVVIDALDAYKKLPSKVSKAWSYMPWASNALTFYDGNRTMAVVGFSMKLFNYYKKL